MQDPVTIRHPEKREGAPRYRGFHQNDLSACIGCGTCEEICMNAAIDMVPIEGVETKDQMEFWEEHGCSAYQGYFYSKPLPLAKLVELMG